MKYIILPFFKHSFRAIICLLVIITVPTVNLFIMAWYLSTKNCLTVFGKFVDEHNLFERTTYPTLKDYLLDRNGKYYSIIEALKNNKTL